MQMKKPNIIIFNPDQMRRDAMGHFGNRAARTPNLDAFQEFDAVSFENAFCQNTVCVPSRCSFTTGLYPHVNGHRTMSYLLHEHDYSIFQELMENGYYVWMNARNDLIAGQIPGLVYEHADEIYLGGDYPQPPGLKNPGIRGKRGEKNYYSFYGGELKLDENGCNYGYDDASVDAAIERIKNPVDERPMCVFIGLTNPHPPYQVEEPFFSAIDRNKIEPRIKASDTIGRAVMESAIREQMGLQEYTEEEWTELRACYLAMCMKVDAMFGKLCDALKETGVYDDSAIFVLSDHGDFTGDYDLPEKAQNTFPDCLTNVPLLIKPPKDFPVDAGITKGMTELIDFYATVMDFAGITPKHTHFGRTLLPVLADRGISVREYAFCEGGRRAEETHCDEFHMFGPDGIAQDQHYFPRLLVQCDAKAHAKGTMIRNHEYKYICRLYGSDEFYDLCKDPQELRNVIQDPAYTDKVEKLRKEMLLWYQDTCDVVPHTYDNRFSYEMSWARMKQCCPKDYEETAKERLKNGDSLFEVLCDCLAIVQKQDS